MRSLLACLVAVVVLALPATAPAATIHPADIRVRDGVVLKAVVFTPGGTGPFPAIVMPTSWGVNNIEYVVQGQRLADDGYVVVSYQPRGWYDSGGEIDTAGPKDVADISDVLDWVEGNTPADPARIGMAGISYGAGLSLLGSAFDPRVKAVAAMSGWTDLVFSLYANQTRHGEAVDDLRKSAEQVGHPSAELRQALDGYVSGNDPAALTTFGAARGAGAYVQQINAHGPAILLANAFGDSFFAPNQLVDFYNRLTVPKRLELRPGDHATPELSGLFGQPNDVWTSVHRWMDHYLRGVADGIDTEKPIQLQPFGSHGYEGYASWGDVSRSSATFGLTGRLSWANRGSLAARATRTGWQWPITGGYDTAANAGTALVTNALGAVTGVPPLVWGPSVDRRNAGVWLTAWPGFGSVRAIRGAPHLHVTVTPSTATSTIVAYLYDTDPIGVGKLIATVPDTARDTAPGTPVTVDTDFPDVAYDVPAGHRLMLVIDTVDPLYLDRAPAGSTVTFGSPAGNASYLRVPLR